MIVAQEDMVTPLAFEVSRCRVPWAAFVSTSPSEGEPSESSGETEPSESLGETEPSESPGESEPSESPGESEPSEPLDRLVIAPTPPELEMQVKSS